jgi:hypothetical protein
MMLIYGVGTFSSLALPPSPGHQERMDLDWESCAPWVDPGGPLLPVPGAHCPLSDDIGSHPPLPGKIHPTLTEPVIAPSQPS